MTDYRLPSSVKTKMNLSLNKRAWVLADQLADDVDLMNVEVTTLSNGSRLIDCGVNVAGGYEAGRIFAEICMGGLGRVAISEMQIQDWTIPAVTVHTDHPETACLAAQYAGWSVQREKYFAMGSGPARGLVRNEKLFEELHHQEQSDRAVLCLETRVLPDSPIADYIAQKAGVMADKLTLLVAPTASIVGGIQISARVVETALHKLHALNFAVDKILNGFGVAPIPPIAKNDARALGRTNDALLFGGQAHLTVRADDAELEALIERVPASASSDYGSPFYEVLKRFDFDFYKIDMMLFSTAEISMTNVSSGRTFRAGHINGGLLRQSYA